MPGPLRFVLVLMVAIATYLFVYWIPFSLIEVGRQMWIPNLVSLICAAAAGWGVWTVTAPGSRGAISSIMYGAFVVGGVGFVAGFFGPMILTPGANQGPLLGLFITGPLGAVLGGIGGLVHWVVGRYRKS